MPGARKPGGRRQTYVALLRGINLGARNKIAMPALRELFAGLEAEDVETYVALLRGINLGARNKIAMPALRELFAGLEAEDVQTYVQSGNVVFKSAGSDRAKLTTAIEKGIRREFGHDVTVLLRTGAELAGIVKRNPFAEGGHDDKSLHVTFLAGTPDRARVRALDPDRHAPDEFRVLRGEVFLHFPDGYGRSKLSNAYFEKQLGVAATTRNWRTVTTVAKLAQG
jgi:uncharacterized protein (DUF1697 family)